MISKHLSRTGNGFLTLVCMLSLCINIFFIISHQHPELAITPRRYIETLRSDEDYSLSQNAISNTVRQGGNRLTRLLEEAHVPNVKSVELTDNQVKDVNTNPTEINLMNCLICPYDPPDLLGSLADMTNEMSPKDLISLFPDMKKGRLRPTQCVARERLAIIIPYRNRYPHLHIFLHNLIPFLIRQQADATFFVIEQAPPETFNRGALLNVGFIEAQKLDDFDCFIFHDVDLIPLDDRHLYRCGDNPKHFAVAMNKHNYKMAYKNYFGGVVGFSRRQYKDINGCSNLYFGWGGEDDDMRERALSRGYSITRSPLDIARYNMIRHSRDKGNEANPVRMKILSMARKRQHIEGLNTIRYRRNNITFHHLYTWINISLNHTEILQSAPPYILEAILSAQKSPPSASKNKWSSTKQEKLPKVETQNQNVSVRLLKHTDKHSLEASFASKFTKNSTISIKPL